MVENEWRGEVHMEGNEKRIRDYGHAASCHQHDTLSLCHKFVRILRL